MERAWTTELSAILSDYFIRPILAQEGILTLLLTLGRRDGDLFFHDFTPPPRGALHADFVAELAAPFAAKDPVTLRLPLQGADSLINE